MNQKLLIAVVSSIVLVSLSSIGVLLTQRYKNRPILVSGHERLTFGNADYNGMLFCTYLRANGCSAIQAESASIRIEPLCGAVTLEHLIEQCNIEFGVDMNHRAPEGGVVVADFPWVSVDVDALSDVTTPDFVRKAVGWGAGPILEIRYRVRPWLTNAYEDKDIRKVTALECEIRRRGDNGIRRFLDQTTIQPK